MPITKKTTSNLTPIPSSEKDEPAQVFDRATLSRRRKDREAQTRDVFAFARDSVAFAQEGFRQLWEAAKDNPQKQFKLEKLVAEGMASILARLAEGHRESARSFLQISQIYAEQAADENDPDRKQRLLARSEEFTSFAASTEENAEEATQQALALKQDAAAVAASLSNNDTD